MNLEPYWLGFYGNDNKTLSMELQVLRAWKCVANWLHEANEAAVVAVVMPAYLINSTANNVFYNPVPARDISAAN